MVKKGKYLTIQGHPEFTNEYVADLIGLRQEMGIFSPEFVSKLPPIDQPSDSKRFAEFIKQFISNKD
jgi:GMP synthase-like glutamine amidotransferase